MPHTTSVLVQHSNGAISYASRGRAQAAVDSGVAYWSDQHTRTKLVMLRSADGDNQAIDGYEYGGKKSYSRDLTVEAWDVRTQTSIRVPVETQDRTGIPVREPGGAKVMQLKPMRIRRTSGQHVTRRDRLWRPRPHELGRGDDTPAQVARLRRNGC
jgi:hypothetical protein